MSSIPESFDSDLYSYYERHKSRTADELYPPLTRARYMELLTLWESMVPGRRILDVGCGVGGFVEAALARGWSAEGIDLATPAIAIGREHGLPVSETDFFSSQIESNSRDMITMFEFIEHVPQPRRFLEHAGRVLRPGGLLYITTPNFDSLERFLLGSAWDVIHHEHLSYFTAKTLHEMVSSIEFLEVIKVRTKNLSVSTLANFMRRPRANGDKAKTNEGFREQIESSVTLRSAKSVANVFLNATGLGSAMTMTIRKRAEASCIEVGGE